jgi:hypothetical protein
MTSSFITALRQQAAPDCRYRSVKVPVCILRLRHRNFEPFGPHTAWQWHQHNTVVRVSKGIHKPVTAVLPSSSPVGLTTIPIVSQDFKHREQLPAVSSLGACLTPAQ